MICDVRVSSRFSFREIVSVGLIKISLFLILEIPASDPLIKGVKG
jgi:hypothetical protein